MFPNDHEAIWGSWWNPELGWGFKCCHQTEKDAMCLGEKGKRIALAKEFKLKKAKQERLSTFAKEVGEHEGEADHTINIEEESKEIVIEKEQENRGPQPEVLPLEVKEPPLVTERPANLRESEKAALIISKPEHRDDQKKPSSTSKQGKF